MTKSNDALPLDDLDFEAELSLRRLKPRLAALWQALDCNSDAVRHFEHRLAKHWPHLFQLLFELYGTRYDFFYHLE